MSFVFNTLKAAQVSAFIMNESKKEKMSYLKLLKLLYLADRESIRRYGFPITGDSPYAMKHGPVLSGTYDLIKGEAHASEQATWSGFFEKHGFDVVLTDDPGNGELCDAEIDILEEIVREYGALDSWKLSGITHRFAEWKQHHIANGSEPIPLADIFKAVERKEDRKKILRKRAEETHFAAIFGG